MHIVLYSMTNSMCVLTVSARLLSWGTANGSNDPGAGNPLTERRLLFCSRDERDSLNPNSSASWIPANRIKLSHNRVL